MYISNTGQAVSGIASLTTTTWRAAVFTTGSSSRYLVSAVALNAWCNSPPCEYRAQVIAT